MQLPVYIWLWGNTVVSGDNQPTLKHSEDLTKLSSTSGSNPQSSSAWKNPNSQQKKALRGPVKQLKMRLAQGFCFLIASLMHHATNCTDLERFRRDYRKGFLAELLSRLSLCIGLGDCINSCVNYGQTYLKASSVALDTYLCTGIWFESSLLLDPPFVSLAYLLDQLFEIRTFSRDVLLWPSISLGCGSLKQPCLQKMHSQVTPRPRELRNLWLSSLNLLSFQHVLNQRYFKIILWLERRKDLMLIPKFNASSKNLPEMSLRLCIDQLANNNFFQK